MEKVNSKIEKQREELGNTLRETAKLHLIINGYNKNLIKFDFNETDSNGKLIGKLDFVVLDKKTKKPIIIVNIEHPSFYDDDYDYDTVNLQSQKFGWPNNHVLSYDGKKFEIIHRIQRPHNNTFDFINQLDENEIKELKNTTSQELFKIHREKHYFSYPIDSFDFADTYLRNHGIGVSDLVNMLMLKYIDETKNDGKLFRSSIKINEQTISEIFENVESFQEYQIKNNTRFESCLKYFDTPVGELLRNCSILDSNPFELIKLISGLTRSPLPSEMFELISDIQHVEKNSTIILDNLPFANVFEHIFLIMEKLKYKIEDQEKFVKLFIIQNNIEEIQKIKFIFKILGLNTDNIQSGITELKIEDKIDYHISLKPLLASFRKPKSDLITYGNDPAKYEIMNLIDESQNNTILSLIISPKILFGKTRIDKIFRYDLLKKIKILAIIDLPRKISSTGIFPTSLIILQKSNKTISKYNIFMSHIDKMDVDFSFVTKDVVKKYGEFKNKTEIKEETDKGFIIKSNYLKEDWTVFHKTPSQKKLSNSLKFSNPVYLPEVAKIIRPSRKISQLENIIRIRDLDDPLFNLKMIGEELKSKKISKDLLDSSIFEPGDILFSTTGTIGKTAKITTKIPNIGLSSGIVIIRPNILKITSDYLKHCLDSKDTAIQTQTRKSTIPFLGAQQLSNIKIDLVELKKQKVIIEKIQVLKNKINKLKIQIMDYENDIKNITTKKT